MGPPQPPNGSRFAIDADPVVAGLTIARTAQRLGEVEAAEATLAELHAAHPGHAEVAGTYARLLVMQGRYEAARDVAAAGGPLGGLRAEAAGLAALHLGQLDAADLAFAALERDAQAAGHEAACGHAARLRGMVAHRRGQLGLASERYREAARRLGEAGERHAAAGAALELGAVLVERGRAGEAVPVLAGARGVLAELGAATERCRVELHHSAALLATGQLEAALAAGQAALAQTAAPLPRSGALPAAGDASHLRSRALLAAGDASRRLGDEPGALHRYREALAIAAQRGDAHGEVLAHVALAEAGQRDSDGLALDARCTSDDDRDRWTLARGRLALRDSRSPLPDEDALAPPSADLARACAAVAARADDQDRLERAFRGHAIAAQLAQRARESSLARDEAARARLAHAALIAATDPANRAAIDSEADFARLPAEPTGARPIGPEGARAEDAALTSRAALRRLLTLARRMHTEPSLERIFDDVIDAAIELTGAERGCLLLRRPDGELAIAATRNWFDDEPDHGGEPRRSPSRAIAERAAQTGETILAIDPALQPRAGAPRIRSVLAVPLRQRGAITGSLYVDHRVRGGAFDSAAAALLGELADLAAVAIENARRAADLRRAVREAEDRSEHLVAELAAHEAELARVTTATAITQIIPAVSQASPAMGDDLTLRPALAAVEQAYIAAAMARANGNQTAAARLLGLSRFGLQKKLRRQSDAADATDADDDPA